VAVRDGVDDGHRPRHRDLQLLLGMRTGKPRFGRVHAALQFQLADDLRHHRFVAVGADTHLDLVSKIDAVNELEKAVHEMLARHLAVGHDIDAGVLLDFERQQRGVGLGGGKLIAARAPLRPELVRLGQPGRLGQASRDGGLEHAFPQMAIFLNLSNHTASRGGARGFRRPSQ
jgi:GNAT superfamily N-acetyltransferase